MKTQALYFLAFTVCNTFSSFAQSGNNTLSFDGSNDYVTLDALAAPLANATDLTVEFWIKTDYQNNTQSPRVNIFAVNPNVPGENKFAIVLGNSGTSQSGQLSIYEHDPINNTNTYLTTQDVIGNNQCHHVAYVRKGSNGEAFIDGVSFGILISIRVPLPCSFFKSLTTSETSSDL